MAISKAEKARLLKIKKAAEAQIAKNQATIAKLEAQQAADAKAKADAAAAAKAEREATIKENAAIRL